MRYIALAADYDGTIAKDGVVSAETLECLRKLRNSGRYLLLVTGRELEDLTRVFPETKIFHRIVAENGAVIFDPETNRITKLNGAKPPEEFVQRLRERGVSPLSVGHIIVATWEPHENVVLDAIRDLGLELQVIFNKGAVMVLPSGVNKASGLRCALQELGLSLHNVVGIGDAENDHAFLSIVEFSVTVANALESVKRNVHFVTEASHGAGACQLMEKMLSTDLEEFSLSLQKRMEIGKTADGREITIELYGQSILIAGTSGGGKTTLASLFLERFMQSEYQFCIIDPEGDYQEFSDVVAVGSTKQEPQISEVMKILEKPENPCSVNLLGIPISDRPSFCRELFTRLQSLRARCGRPHWLILDELHHYLPEERTEADTSAPVPFRELLMITVHPEHVSRSVLNLIDVLLIIGSSPDQTIKRFCDVTGYSIPEGVPTQDLEKGSAIVWRPRTDASVIVFQTHSSQMKHLRHIRKYSHGDLGEERSFYFRGPKSQLNLRAQNLSVFLQMADGVDDKTWLHHLKKGEYSAWLRSAIKDDELADEVAEVERSKLSAKESKEKIKDAIERRYTAPA